MHDGVWYGVSRRGSLGAATPLRVGGVGVVGVGVGDGVVVLHYIRSVGEPWVHPLFLLYAGLASTARC